MDMVPMRRLRWVRLPPQEYLSLRLQGFTPDASPDVDAEPPSGRYIYADTRPYTAVYSEEHCPVTVTVTRLNQEP